MSSLPTLCLRTAMIVCAALISFACDSSQDGSDTTPDAGAADASGASDGSGNPTACAEPNACGAVREASLLGRGDVVATAVNEDAVFVLGNTALEVYAPSGGARISEWRIPTDRQPIALALDGRHILVVSRLIGEWQDEEPPDGEEFWEPDPEHSPVRAHVIDVSEPSSPTELGGATVPGDSDSAWAAASLSGNRAAVHIFGPEGTHVHLFDLSEPSQPERGADMWFRWEATAHDIELVGETLYVSGISRYDAAPNPEAEPGPEPEADPEEDPDGDPKGGGVVGRLAVYVAAWDVGDPSAPLLMSYRRVAPADFGEQTPQTRVAADERSVVLAFDGRVADRGSSVSGLCAFGPDDLTLLGETPLDGYPEAFHVHDGTAWVAEGDRLRAYATFDDMTLLSDEPLPDELNTWLWSGSRSSGARIVAVAGSELQVVTLGPGSFEAETFQIGRIGPAHAYSAAWTPDGLVVADNDELRFFATCDLAGELPTLILADGTGRLQAFGSRVLAAASGDVRLFDLSDPAAPTETALSEDIRAVAATEDAVFAVTSDALVILDWSGAELGRAETEELRLDDNEMGLGPLVAVDGTTVVVSPSFGVTFDGEDAHFLVFDVGDPTAPVLTRTYVHESTFIQQLELRDDAVWIWSGGALLGGALSDVPNLAEWTPLPGFERVDGFAAHPSGWWVVLGDESETTNAVVEWTPEGPGATIAELPYRANGEVADVVYNGTHLAAARSAWGHSVHGVACD